MPDTRNFKSPGIWGLDAEISIPLTPTEGVAYRNTALTQAQTEEGEKYNTRPDSANFNQVMFTITSFLDDMDSHGVIGWYSEVDYLELPSGAMGSITRGSDGNFYTALLESGPGTVAGAKDPISEPTYWARIFGSSGFELDLTSQTPGAEGARLVGTSYQPDVIDFPSAIEQPVQTSLETVNKQSYYLRGLALMLSGKFDETGALTGNAFNILNNEAEWVQQNGYSYYRISPADDSIIKTALFTPNYYVAPERTIDPSNNSNVLTANTFIIIGPWSAEGVEIDDSNSIKILFTDPFNVLTHLKIPFSITGLITAIKNGQVV